MAILGTDIPFSLNAGNPSMQSPSAAVPQLTDMLEVRIRRPTTANPNNGWNASGRLKITMVLVIDGLEHKVSGTTSGGVRSDDLGNEMPDYILTYRTTFYFGQKGKDYCAQNPPEADGSHKNVPMTRIAEGANTVRAYLLLERLAGNISSTVAVFRNTDSPAPTGDHKNSVAFDAATDVSETTGDGTVSLTHTASGSDRAVFAAVYGRTNPAPTAYPVTYAGNAGTSIWFTTGAFANERSAASYFKEASVPTGAQTVSCTKTGGTITFQSMGVVSMTGVHQTTSIGTFNSASGAQTVTVASVGADDLVVDAFCSDTGGTAGADQTQRFTETGAGRLHQGGTQLGTAGGVMSYTGSPFAIDIGAVAFKPSTAVTVIKPKPIRALQAINRASDW